MVRRVYVEKKPSEALEAKALLADIRNFLGISSLKSLRIVNRYDVENIDDGLFHRCKNLVFSEPQLDIVSTRLTETEGCKLFAVEYLPGQFDQRADSAAQCIQVVSHGEKPVVRTAKVYITFGALTDAEVDAIKRYVINPVECREAALETYTTLESSFEMPDKVAILKGFRNLKDEQLSSFISENGLAMDTEDLRFCRSYFINEQRDPTITELKVLDTYWSDHCRHTTFSTVIDGVRFDDIMLNRAWNEYLRARAELGIMKPMCLMDIATIAAKQLRRQDKLPRLDISDEINACTVKITVTTPTGPERWLLLFKNETHNHPTEIEPLGGAATCIGGAIRDPLSGRGYVYAAMRISGASDPTVPLSETLPGKLPQRKLVSTAAAGYSSYGNQVGLATGIVDEVYHPGYVAKHMELGAVIAAVPEENVRRERPAPGDIVILLGGKTGRDGCGGATGSSKAHDLTSLDSCGAEVQKGNPPEERKLQRLFRNSTASRMIKRCNDFGAGGVSVAIGELADGLEINLSAIPKKYEGLTGTELAISESQERMAVVVDRSQANQFIALAQAENLEATVVAQVTESPRLRMAWNGKTVVDLSREFLDSNGAEKHIIIAPESPKPIFREIPTSFTAGYLSLVSNLNICSKRGLAERFDSTIGGGTVLMPFGGRNQLTPIQAMAHKIPVERGDTETCSIMSYGFNPLISEKSPYHGAYLAVVESISKLIATGAEFNDVYLSFQEYFEKPGNDERRWGKPLSALLGAYMAQMDLGVAAIGGKDSMSGSFEDIDVPPTLISFAVTTGRVSNVISPEFKAADHKICLLLPEYQEDGLPKAESLIENFNIVSRLIGSGEVCSAYTPVDGGIAEGIFKMCIGNSLGFSFAYDISLDDIFGYRYGAFILEFTGNETVGLSIGKTRSLPEIKYGGETVDLRDLLLRYETRLEGVYSCNIKTEDKPTVPYTYVRKTSFLRPTFATPRPRAIVPIFPGTNCEYETIKAIESAGCIAQPVIIKNLSPSDIAQSTEFFAKELKNAQIVILPGGFSGGDEPDGSAKFITCFFRNAEVRKELDKLLSVRDGLMLGICNGFQALIKLGLLPYGHIMDTDERCPTLSFNNIGRHQSKLVRTRVSSNLSPWLMHTAPGEIYTVPISHGEGRFLCPEDLIKRLGENGQIATQYVDLAGNVTQDIRFNPNGSACAVEGLTSPDGRIFGKMGHSERIGNGLYKNVDGNFDMQLFRSAVEYFR